MTATRDAFGEYLCALAKKDDRIVALNADLAAATRLTKFKKEFPNRFFEFGIAENNMIGAAGGLAIRGLKPFAVSFASFLTGKYDTIRVSIAQPQLEAVLVGTHAGLAIGKDGQTQMGLEDIGLMRGLNMTVYNPSTPVMTKWCMNSMLKVSKWGPSYLRLGRQPVFDYYSDLYISDSLMDISSEKYRFDRLIINSGCCLHACMDAVNYLGGSCKGEPRKLRKTKVLDLNLVAPVHKLYDYLARAKVVVTVEDHSVKTGMGAMVASIIAKEKFNCKQYMVGWDSHLFPGSGSPDDLYKAAGITPEKISELVCK